MSKHSKIVTVTVDARAKQKLQGASKAAAEVVTAILVGSDDTFGPRQAR
jgi:hypothetical protein